MAVSCMRNASDHNYRNRLVIMDLAIGQIPRSIESISSNSWNNPLYPEHVPLKMGANCQHVRGPELQNCPSASSR